MTDALNQFGVEGLTDLGYHGRACLTVGGVESDFDQFMMTEGAFEFAQDGRAETAGTDDDHRLTLVGECFQMTFLGIGEHRKGLASCMV